MSKHKNKYAHKVAPYEKSYNKKDKTFRDLLVKGSKHEVIAKGVRIMYHGRVYETTKEVRLNDLGEGTISCQLVHYIPDKINLKKKKF